MTSSRRNCCEVLSSGTEAAYTGKPCEILGKLKTETNDQFPLRYILPSLNSITRRGPPGPAFICFEKFRLKCSVNLPLPWKIAPNSNRNSASSILPLGTVLLSYENLFVQIVSHKHPLMTCYNGNVPLSSRQAVGSSFLLYVRAQPDFNADATLFRLLLP